MDIIKKQVKLPIKSLSTVDSLNRYLVRYRIVSDDKNRISHWSPLYTVPALPIVDVTSKSTTERIGNLLPASWTDDNKRSSYDVFIKYSFEVHKASLTNNVATIETTVQHDLVQGDTVVISGVNAIYNGTYVITAVNGGSTTMSYAKVNADINQATISPTGRVGKDYNYYDSPSTTQINITKPVTNKATKAMVKVQVGSHDKVLHSNLVIYTSTEVSLV